MDRRQALLLATLAYGTASFAHFLHNAVHLDAYPNLPEHWTPASVMLSWLPIAAVGAAGTLLHRRGRPSGLWLLAAFGVSGYAGLLHYAVAPFSAHTAPMHAGIWAESVTGTLLLATLFRGRGTQAAPRG